MHKLKVGGDCKVCWMFYLLAFKWNVVFSSLKMITLSVSVLLQGNGDGGLLYPWHAGETAGSWTQKGRSHGL